MILSRGTPPHLTDLNPRRETCIAAYAAEVCPTPFGTIPVRVSGGRDEPAKHTKDPALPPHPHRPLGHDAAGIVAFTVSSSRPDRGQRQALHQPTCGAVGGSPNQRL